MLLVKALGYLWALPNALIGFVLCLAYWPFEAKVRDGALHLRCKRVFPKFAAAQTWGWLVVNNKRWSSSKTSVHEYAHVLQSMVLGPLFLIAYPLASLWAIINRKHSYKDNWFEIHARDYADRNYRP